MKKIFIVVLVLSCFTTSQARPIGNWGGGGGPFWFPVATVVTIFGLISLNNQNEHRDYEDKVMETTDLLEDAESIDELNKVKRTHLRYFTESVENLYKERKNYLSSINYPHENITDKENLTIFLIHDAETLTELEKIKQERLKYFTDKVQDEYFKKKNLLKLKK